MRFVSAVLLLVVVTMASAAPSEKKKFDLNNAHVYFEDFIKEHNRQYKDDADKDAHFHAFVANLEKINKLNEANTSATYGINKFADYTEEERKGMFGLRKPSQ